MPRYVKVAAAQLGAIPEGTTREQMVERMLALMEQAAVEGVEILAYDELTMIAARGRWNFFGRRHPEHYGLITQPVGGR